MSLPQIQGNRSLKLFLYILTCVLTAGPPCLYIAFPVHIWVLYNYISGEVNSLKGAEDYLMPVG